MLVLLEGSSCLSNTATKKPSYFPLYWLFNRDPYHGLLERLYKWVVFHPLYTVNNQGCL